MGEPIEINLSDDGLADDVEEVRARLTVSSGLRRIVIRGGPGSGHFGHEGRPGEIGGSADSPGAGDDAPKAAAAPEAPMSVEETKPGNGERLSKFEHGPALEEFLAGKGSPLGLRIEPPAADAFLSKYSESMREVNKKLWFNAVEENYSRWIEGQFGAKRQGGLPDPETGIWAPSDAYSLAYYANLDAIAPYMKEYADDLGTRDPAGAEAVRANFETTRQLGPYTVAANKVFQSTRRDRVTREQVKTMVDEAKDIPWALKSRATAHVILAKMNQFSYTDPAYAMTMRGGPLRRIVITRGGAGSGHFGHQGIPGQVGGSKDSPGKGNDAPKTGVAPGQKVTATGRIVPPNAALIDSSDKHLMEQPSQRVGEGVESYSYTTEEWLDAAEEVMAEQPPEVAKKIADVEAALKTGKRTMDLYSDGKGNYDAERTKLHDSILEKMFGRATPVAEGETPRMTLTGGLPGSGKSTVLSARREQGLADLEGSVHIDSDWVKEQLPEYEGWNAALIHDEASDIIASAMSRARAEHYSVVYDTTMKTTQETINFVNAAKEAGYSAHVIYVDVPMKMSMRRAISRFMDPKSGRYVSPYYIASNDGKNVGTFGTLKGLVDTWEHWDNATPGGRPTLVASSKP
jgi:predicted ABC-type ATPase